MKLIRNGIINNMRSISSRRMYTICSVLVGMFIGSFLINLGSNEIFNFVASSTNTFGTEFSELTSKRVFNGIETVEWCQCKIERVVDFWISIISFSLFKYVMTETHQSSLMSFSSNYLQYHNIHHYHLKIATTRIFCFGSLFTVD